MLSSNPLVLAVMGAAVIVAASVVALVSGTALVILREFPLLVLGAVGIGLILRGRKR